MLREVPTPNGNIDSIDSGPAANTPMAHSGYQRNRWLLVGLGLVVIVLGLASRKYSTLLPEMFGTYPGDALWAVTAYLAIAFMMPSMPVRKVAGIALAVSCLVEFSQLIQVPWLNAVRGTRVGHLLLGQGFDWLDLVALTVGIAVAASVDAVCERNARCAGAANDEMRRRSK